MINIFIKIPRELMIKRNLLNVKYCSIIMVQEIQYCEMWETTFNHWIGFHSRYLCVGCMFQGKRSRTYMCGISLYEW
jgi:hypothetical protein